MLRFSDHPRKFEKFSYIYPVVSRRAQGVSVGVNLCLNNECNWRCAYCQVDGLIRGRPSPVDLAKLEDELDHMLNLIVNGDFLTKYAPTNLARFNDICLAGNGEPTLSSSFLEVCYIIAKLRNKYGLANEVKSILITNGSEILREDVQQALSVLKHNNGEVWFKIDRATKQGIFEVNQVNLNLDGIILRLELCASLCRSYVQSCWFKNYGLEPEPSELDAFIKLITQVKTKLKGVLLYSTARNPALDIGANITQVSESFLAGLAKQLQKIGVDAKYYV